VFFTSGKPGITTAAPIFDKNNQLQGIIGVDIEISELSEFIANLKISENGKVFIMNDSLKVIAFPNKDTIELSQNKLKKRLKTIDEVDEIAYKSYQELKKQMTNDIKAESLVTFDYDTKTYHSMYFPFTINNMKWIIGMYVPEDDYIGMIKNNQKNNIIMSIIIAFIALGVGYKIADTLSKPIKRMEKMAYDLHHLNLHIPSVEGSKIKEIDEAIQSFNSMKDNLNESYLDTLNRLAIASEYKDTDTSEHIRRMGLYSEVIGKGIGLSSKDLYLLRHASEMHDIGKLGIPDKILMKPGKLNEDERRIIETHSQIGARILKNPTSTIMEKAREIALFHHEKWDGTGYPQKRRGEDIPLFARIVAIVDVFDALVSKRCYKEAFSLEKSKQIILEGRGTHFDPQCVDAFIANFEEIEMIFIDNQNG
jgi:putative two-component system response regulator